MKRISTIILASAVFVMGGFKVGGSSSPQDEIPNQLLEEAISASGSITQGPLSHVIEKLRGKLRECGHTLDSIHDIMDALSSLEKDSDRLKQDEEELDKRRIGLRRRYFEIGAQLAGWLEARDELKKLQGITVLLKQLDHQTPSPGQE